MFDTREAREVFNSCKHVKLYNDRGELTSSGYYFIHEVNELLPAALDRIEELQKALAECAGY